VRRAGDSRGDEPAPPDASAAGAAEATTGASLLAGSAWATAARVIPQLYTLVISVAAGRILGTELFGRQSFIAFVSLSVVLLLTAGLPVALMRYVGESLGRGDGAAVRGLVAWAWRIEFVAALIGAGCLAGAALLGADPGGAWLLAAAAAAAGILHAVPSALLIGAQRWRAASVVGIVSGLVGAAATIAVLAAGGGITGMFAVEAAVSVVNLGITSRLARGALAGLGANPAPASRAVEIRGEAGRYALLASAGVLVTLVVWRRSEVFFLERFSTDAEIAFYSVAFAAFMALAQFPAAISSVVSPAVATLYGAGADERIRLGYERALRLLLLLALPLTAGALTLGPAALRLAYGDEFSEAGTVFLILAAWFPVFPLVNMSRGVLTGVGRVKVPLVVGAVAAAVDVGLALALTPSRGAIGAAIANVGAQLAAALPLLVYTARVVGSTGWRPWPLWRILVASLLAGAAAWAVVALEDGPVGVAAAALLGAAVLGLVALILRVLDPDDAAWLEQAAGRRLGGGVGRLCRRCAYAR